MRAPSSKAPAGRYEIKPFVLREATPTDRQHVAAERLFEQGRKLRGGSAAADRRAGIGKFEQALPLYQAAGDTYRQALALLSISFANGQLNEPRRGLEFGSQVVALARSFEDRRLEAAAETFLGGMRDLLGDVKEALEHFNRAGALARESGNRSAEASAVANIGTVYYNVADWPQASFRR